MYSWTFQYVPAMHTFSRLFETVKANNYDMAKAKFYARVGDNVLEIISCEKSNS